MIRSMMAKMIEEESETQVDLSDVDCEEENGGESETETEDMDVDCED